MTKDIQAKRMVLIVDDVQSVRVLAKAVLASDRTTVLEAANGEEGIAMALDQQPDVILLDLAMPGLDGPETLQRLRAVPETRDIPVVIITALPNSEMAQRASALGAVALLEKPFRPAELRHLVDKWAA